ncbi:hypothetical protein [Desulfonatronovibrio hydrogenovorans]|uniref:hypothetical protein n=1 Tax=Desulfonatronovibrio hydrogenovorans TaxID=53245 RepID=UPI0004910CF1|nr:hypothetical protein [Desulfonatronovibrio hydrogenovorans]
MQNTRTLSPETMTAVEMLESITPGQRSQALEILRNFVDEINNEQKWQKLYAESSEPMIRMSRQALEEHQSGNSRKMQP